MTVRPLVLAATMVVAASACAAVGGEAFEPSPSPTQAADDRAEQGEQEGAPQAQREPARVAPPLTGIDGWLQADIESLDDLRGQVVIVQFWTFGCINCKRTLPHLQDLYERFGGDGLEIVGVHSPEFDYEKDPDAIQRAANDLGVTWPIALDTERRSFRAWQGRPAYWPRTYVLDRDGHIRFDHIGEGRYDDLEATVAGLLAG